MFAKFVSIIQRMIRKKSGKSNDAPPPQLISATFAFNCLLSSEDIWTPSGLNNPRRLDTHRRRSESLSPINFRSKVHCELLLASRSLPCLPSSAKLLVNISENSAISACENFVSSRAAVSRSSSSSSPPLAINLKKCASTQIVTLESPISSAMQLSTPALNAWWRASSTFSNIAFRSSHVRILTPRSMRIQRNLPLLTLILSSAPKAMYFSRNNSNSSFDQ
mmetsp:Transcript_102662/g.162245  ORF Transcript_102662/g.162245 Transcript_102662/m.162245 type:complete len:221 (+) Transcript_102662:457-1119(+)